MAAAIANAEKYNPDKSKIENISKSISGTLGFFGDQSYVRSIGDLVDAIQGGVNIGPAAISAEASNLAGQLIPYKSFLTWLGRITDPTYRKAKTFKERMIKDLPVVGESLEPYTNMEGQPSMRDFPGLNAVSPYKVSQEKPGVEMYNEYQTKKINKAVEKRADEEFMKGNETEKLSGNIFRYIDEEGALKKIDMNPVEKPELTGQTELDKIKISSYNSKITAQIKGIAKLEELNQITPEEAEKTISSLLDSKITAPKKAKKLTLKKVSLPKIPAPIKVKKVTVKRPSKSVKSLRSSKKKITKKKINLNAKV
jgi:hypothetical protein